MTGFFWILLGLLLLFALMSSSSLRDHRHASLYDLFALNRYQWYGNLKTDVRTARQQLRRDRNRLFQFVNDNIAWVLATTTGMIGLLLTASMMIGFIPASMKAAVSQTLQTDRISAEASFPEILETKTDIPDYVFTSNDPSVSMEIKGLLFGHQPSESRFGEPDRIIAAGGVEEISAKEPVQFRRNIRIFDRLPRHSANTFEDQNQELLVVAQAVAGAANRLPPKMHQLVEEVITGDVRRQDNRLETQVAGLHVEKIYPESVAPGQPLHYEIILHNVSDETIGRVRIEETIPDEAQLLNTVPQAEKSALDRRPVWIVDLLEPDETQTIQVQIDVDKMDSIRTNTRVLVRGAYSQPSDVSVTKESKTPAPEQSSVSDPEPEIVRSRNKSASQSREPQAEAIGRVRIEVTGPKRARVGDNVALKFRLYNYGTEPIDNASIRVQLDPRIRAKSGDVWLVQIKPVLEPGQSRIATFQGQAVQDGAAINRIDVLFGKNIVRTGERRLDIVAD